MAKQEVIDAVLALADEYGRVTPDQVLEAARDPDSALHHLIEWDLNIAAKAHQLEQARRIIVSVEYHCVYENISFSVPYHVRDPGAPAREQGYRSVVQLRSSEEMARATLVQEMARVAASLKRARRYAIVLGLPDRLGALDAAVAEFVAGLNDSLQEPQPEPEPSATARERRHQRGRWTKRRQGQGAGARA